jgi:hypothetical protein
MSTPAGQMKPDKSAMDIHAASHGVAMQAAKSHGDALTKLHASISQLLQGQMQQGAPPQGPSDTGGGDPQQQAVWSAFPSTDPQAVAQLMQQSGGDPHAALQALSQQQEQDMASLHDQMMQRLAEVLDQMGAPGGEAAPAAPVGPPPAVGGSTTGAY